MCGIVGYLGPRNAAPILLNGLSRLVYRGYDSAGLAVHTGDGIAVRKVVGPVERLTEQLCRSPIPGTLGIGHTRWATHGPPTETNAHPHVDCRGEIALVHNGIIENAEALRTHLQGLGHEFRSGTDTETLTHLVEEAVGATLEERVLDALRHVEGTYGIAVICASEPDKIVVARQGSPVLLGVGDGEFFVSSDVSAVREHTTAVVYLEDGDMAVVTPEGYRVMDREAQPQERGVDGVEWDLEAIELAGYDHYMLKEIYEQPDALERTLAGRLQPADGTARLNGLNLGRQALAAIERIDIVACGTSWHAGLIGRHLIEELSGIPVRVEYASEYGYRRPLQANGTLTVAISQSGETADTLQALRTANAAGSRVIGIVNVVGSTIARECHGGIYLHAGPEIGVASTKAFVCQVGALLLLGLFLGAHRRYAGKQRREVAQEALRLPALVRRALESDEPVRELALACQDQRSFLYLGRGISFPVALEGALKLKEISYIHAEGYPAAEMKHGPLALVQQGLPAMFVAPQDSVYRKVLSNIEEVKARGGRTLVVTSEATISPNGNGRPPLADHVLHVPGTHPLLSPIVTVIPLQLFAYHVAVLRGCNVDRPRNLAKSVTVE